MNIFNWTFACLMLVKKQSKYLQRTGTRDEYVILHH